MLTSILTDDDPWTPIAKAAGIDISSCQTIFLPPMIPICVQGKVAEHLAATRPETSVSTMSRDEIRANCRRFRGVCLQQMVADACRLVSVYPPICVLQKSLASMAKIASGPEGSR